MILKIGLLFSAILLSSCSTLHETKGDVQLTTKVKWVKSTTDGFHREYRKVNAMASLLYKDKVIQGNGVDGLAAYTQESGDLVWKLKVRGGVEGGAALIRDRIFFGGNDGQFYSADAATGKIVWTFPTRTETLTAPLLHEGIIYFLAGNNILYALDASTGQQLWLYSRVDNQNITVRGGSVPLYYKGQIITGFSDGFLVSLDAKTGVLKWEKPLSKNIKYKDIDGSAVVHNEILYVLGYDSALFAVGANNGELLWRAEPGGVSEVLIFNNQLFYSSSTGEVIAADLKTGAPKWRYKLSDGIASTVSLYLGKYLIFQESLTHLTVLDIKSGKVIAQFDPGRGGVSRVTTDEDNRLVYFITNEANLYALRVFESATNEGVPWLLK